MTRPILSTVDWESKIDDKIRGLIDNRLIVSFGSGEPTTQDFIDDMTVREARELKEKLSRELSRIETMSQSIIELKDLIERRSR